MDLAMFEGKNIIFEYRSADDKLERLPALAHELVRLNINLLLDVLARLRCSRQKRSRIIPSLFMEALILLQLGLS